MRAAVPLICAVLRGEAPPSLEASGLSPEAIIEASARHGVDGLLADRLGTGEAWDAVAAVVSARTRDRTAWELRHARILAEVLTAFEARGIAALVLKGTALAYSIYPDPVLRTRSDTDLAVAESDYAKAQGILEHCGFEPAVSLQADLLSYQSSYIREAPEGGLHNIDLHTRLSNSELLSRVLDFEELRSSAVPLGRLHSSARMAGPVHALLFACLHMAIHREVAYFHGDIPLFGGNRLVWVHDVHLLSGQLDEAGWQDFISLAQRKGLAQCCLDALKMSRTCFATPMPDVVLAGLQPGADMGRIDAYLASGKLRRKWIDFTAVSGAGAKLQFLRVSLFPPAAYVRRQFGSKGTESLPALYAARLMRGIVKYARRLRSSPGGL